MPTWITPRDITSSTPIPRFSLFAFPVVRQLGMSLEHSSNALITSTFGFSTALCRQDFALFILEHLLAETGGL